MTLSQPEAVSLTESQRQRAFGSRERFMRAAHVG